MQRDLIGIIHFHLYNTSFSAFFTLFDGVVSVCTNQNIQTNRHQHQKCISNVIFSGAMSIEKIYKFETYQFLYYITITH